MDIVNSYFKRFYPDDLSSDAFRYTDMLGGMFEYKDRTKRPIFPQMICADGFSMSVQGHFGAYSTPRDDFADHYTSVEVGFPSEAEDLLMPYADDPEQPTKTVYGWVPIDVVVQVIEKHGGLKAA